MLIISTIVFVIRHSCIMILHSAIIYFPIDNPQSIHGQFWKDGTKWKGTLWVKTEARKYKICLPIFNSKIIYTFSKQLVSLRKCRQFNIPAFVPFFPNSCSTSILCTQIRTFVMEDLGCGIMIFTTRLGWTGFLVRAKHQRKELDLVETTQRRKVLKLDNSVRFKLQIRI